MRSPSRFLEAQPFDPDRFQIDAVEAFEDGASVVVTVVISGIDYVWSWSRRARRGE